MGRCAWVVVVVLMILSGCDRIGVGPDVETVERTDYNPPTPPDDDPLTDDRIEDKSPAFDPDLAHPEPRDGWRINLSAAVIRLDVPMIFPDSEQDLLTLHRSYADAMKAAGARGGATLLPSVNLIDGKAKQFDDGLYAALELAAFPETLDRFERLRKAVGPESPAAPFLAAGLTIAGRPVDAGPAGAVASWVRAFEDDPVRSRPIGFYTWTPELSACFRTLRFYQRPFHGDLTIPKAIAAALAKDAELRRDYEAILAMSARLTNPLDGLSCADLIDRTEPVPSSVGVALLPASASREAELFERLFPLGLPDGVDLMRELVRRIRSGEVDLSPRPDGGWYDRQVFALETLLLPERGEENAKLLLAKTYKARMLDAFKALITKRRETHARQLKTAVGAPAPPPLKSVTPRLRLEPNATYYLRTARAYAFLLDFLDATLGVDALGQLHGLREDGPRSPDLRAELRGMRDLFYGCYLLSCEDIGAKPSLSADEPVEADPCKASALQWLAAIADDPDLARDTRVSVPIYADLAKRRTKLWATLGVRLAKLDARFVRPPSLRTAEGGGDWAEAESHTLDAAHYLIPVDEFAEVELPRLDALTRDQLRAICDQGATREGILALFARGR